MKVSAGDTLQVLHDGKPEKVRLAGIDCPERGQPFGDKAKKFTLKESAQKIVQVEVETTDRYGQTVGEVILPDGRSLNEELVKEGYAWHYKKYSKDQVLARLEVEARDAKRGLWADPHPIPPWELRQGQREAKTDHQVQATGEIVYHGNVKSRVYHRPGCKNYDCKQCLEVFQSRKEAQYAGYSACHICKP